MAALLPGSRLGPYEVIIRIGAGGMGEVYKARDTRLNRTVAIKILRPEFAQRSGWKQRFTREAQPIAATSINTRYRKMGGAFSMITPAGNPESLPITVVLNWISQPR